MNPTEHVPELYELAPKTFAAKYLPHWTESDDKEYKL